MSEQTAIQINSQDSYEIVSTATGSWHPRLQLGGSSSKEVKSRRVQMGNHFLVDGEVITDLGLSLDLAVLNWLPKALEIGKDNKITSNFDPKSAEFKRIMALSGIKDSGAMYGPAYLVYIPSIQKFAEYFMASKTARKSSKDMQAALGKNVTLTSLLIDNGQYSWFGPVITQTASPIQLPQNEDLLAANDKFLNQKKSIVEQVAEPAGRAR